MRDIAREINADTIMLSVNVEKYINETIESVLG